VTQGRVHCTVTQWVSSYWVLYSEDGMTWHNATHDGDVLEVICLCVPRLSVCPPSVCMCPLSVVGSVGDQLLGSLQRGRDDLEERDRPRRRSGGKSRCLCSLCSHLPLNVCPCPIYGNVIYTFISVSDLYSSLHVPYMVMLYTCFHLSLAPTRLSISHIW
jgi:hypothetical protein